jgi:hypothetical protein
MIDTARLLTILIQAGSFISAFAAIAASVVMASLTKKFGTGILASGFKTNSVGVLLIALGIFVDALQTYVQVGGYGHVVGDMILSILLMVKYIFFVVGTYVIVIGSKKTGDKLEGLMK